jgi:trehalose 6-phosphate phosphatase
VTACDPKQWSLFLDFDGTLVDIAPSPSSITVPPDLPALLARLQDIFAGAVAVVTGRPITDVDHLLAPLRLVTAGIHGTQMRRSCNGPMDTIAPGLPAELIKAIAALTAIGTGLIVEAKSTAISVHYRLAPEARTDVERAVQEIVARYEGSVTVCHGRMVVEVLPAAYSKGRAVRMLCEVEPFVGRRPLMIGDDAPDRSALLAAADLGGVGLTVGGEHFAVDSANFRDTAAVRRWLACIADRAAIDGIPHSNDGWRMTCEGQPIRQEAEQYSGQSGLRARRG